jgi:4-amino-4-deoxy-L-arabinose transferase-like glycosyltransferase
VSNVRLHLLILLCVASFFVGLGRPAVTDSDEAFYAQAAREMVEGGDWVTPRFNGQYRFEKPVLYYWLAAVGFLLGGVNEFGARLPSALAGLALALIAYACARRWYDESTGLYAGAISATSFGYIAVGRQALPDLALAGCITLAIWASIVALVAPRPPGHDRKRRRWLVLSGMALGAGFLIKGPVGLLLPALVVGPLALWRCWSDRNTPVDGERARFVTLLGDISLLTGVCLLLAVPWFAAMTHTHGVAYLERFFITENVQRFATERYNAPRPLWYYLPIVVGGLLPWSPLMLLWWAPLARIVRRVRQIEPVEIWLAVWALTPLLFYSLSIGKQPRYILPILPPLAVLLARAISRRIGPANPERHTAPRDRLLAVAGLMSGLILVLFGILVYGARSLLIGVSSVVVITGVTLLVASGVAVGAIAVSRRQRLIPLTIAVAAVVSTLSLQYVVLSRPGPEPVEEMAAMVQAAGPSSLPYGRYRVFVRNLVFYTGRPYIDLSSEEQVRTFLLSGEKVLCVLTEEDLRRVRATGVQTHELGRVSYLNTGSLTFRTLLQPDPDLDVQTVVLVTNQAPG